MAHVASPLVNSHPAANTLGLDTATVILCPRVSRRWRHAAHRLLACALGPGEAGPGALGVLVGAGGPRTLIERIPPVSGPPLFHTHSVLTMLAAVLTCGAPRTASVAYQLAWRGGLRQPAAKHAQIQTRRARPNASGADAEHAQDTLCQIPPREEASRGRDAHISGVAAANPMKSRKSRPICSPRIAAPLTGDVRPGATARLPRFGAPRGRCRCAGEAGSARWAENAYLPGAVPHTLTR